MAGNRETKNFGLIKAIHVGVNPPLNVKIIWFDDNPGVKIHKAYNVATSAWEPFGSGATINGIYTYIGYSTGVDGANFATVKADTHTHWAVITSNTAIATLTSTLFAGRWTKYDGVGSGGNYTYVGFADSESGDNFSVEPKTEVACSVCSWVDSFVVRSVTGGFTITAVTDGVRVDFTNVVHGNVIELELKRGTTAIPNLTQQYFEVVKETGWSAEGVLELNTDANSTNNYVIYNAAGGSDSFIKTVNGSVARVKVSSTGVSGFSGSIILKVGSTECEPSYVAPANCYEYRKFIGIKTQDTAATVVNAALFTGLWAPLLDSNSTSEEGNVNEQIAKLWDEITATNTELDALGSSYDTFVTTQNTFNTTLEAKVDNNHASINTTLQAMDIEIDGAYARANHTGVQAISTITGLTESLATFLQKSDNLTKVVFLLQSEYDALVAAGTQDPTIIYLTPKTV